MITDDSVTLGLGPKALIMVFFTTTVGVLLVVLGYALGTYAEILTAELMGMIGG